MPPSGQPCSSIRRVAGARGEARWASKVRAATRTAASLSLASLVNQKVPPTCAHRGLQPCSLLVAPLDLQGLQLSRQCTTTMQLLMLALCARLPCCTASSTISLERLMLSPSCWQPCLVFMLQHGSQINGHSQQRTAPSQHEPVHISD